MHDELEQRLSDYLDGRLDPAERARFDERLARDAELRARLEEYRAIGSALRDDPAELPPGFYARARERFETAHGKQRWFRPLSWEAVGALAAAGLVLALFLPEMMRDRSFELPLRQAVPAKNRQPAVAEPRPAETPDARAPLEQSAPESEAGSKPQEPRRKRAEDEREPVQQTPGKDEPRQDAAFAPAPPEAARRERQLEQSKPAAAPAPEDASYREYEESRDFLREDVAGDRAAAAPLDAPVAGFFDLDVAPQPPLAVAPLATGVVAPNEVRIVAGQTEGESKRRLAARVSEPDAAAGGEDVSGLRPDPRTQRLVLIGPRSYPFDCAAIRLLAGPTLRVVVPPAGAADETAPGGCALIVPAGFSTVEVVEPGPE